MYPVSEYRNSNEFAEWLNRYNRLNHADLTTKTAPECLLVEFAEMGINSMEVERLTAENAKMREQLAILIEGATAADELIMMLHGIATHTANSPKVTPPGQDAARQMLAKIAAYHEKYT